jgi:Flp pilus assembly protein TadD
MVKQKYLVLFLVFVLIFTACAGVLTKPEAKKQFEQGLTFFNHGKYKEAIPYFERATEVDPEFSKAHLYLGRSYLNLSMWQKAIPPLRTAYTLSPEQLKKEIVNLMLDAFLGAALNEFKKGDFTNSAQFLKEALRWSPESVKVKTELATTLVALGGKLLSEGNMREAISAFTETTAVSPNNLDAYLGLARALFKNGDFFQALNAVKHAITIEPANNEAQSLFKEILSQ